MSNIYLVNVGCNTAHSSIARSPRFANGSFVFVPFPCPNPDEEFVRQYSPMYVPFVRNCILTHDDPDWPYLTYGDDCNNPRARALCHVAQGDILLFWGLLCNNAGNAWATFDGNSGWYLLGALRVAEILVGGQTPEDAHADHVPRARRNVHFNDGVLRATDRVFVADPEYSTLFTTAVDLEVGNEQGLVYSAMRTATGLRLCRNGSPKWSSSLRACRRMWDLDDPEHWQRAQLVRNAILADNNNYDLLRDIVHA
jgi:hypothetical protein